MKEKFYGTLAVDQVLIKTPRDEILSNSIIIYFLTNFITSSYLLVTSNNKC